MRTGELIDGRYRLQRQIGEGGMAVVWLAHDERLERPVAVKLLIGGNTREQAAVAEQFLREAKLAASVRHRHVVQILDFGKHDGAVPFMVMEALVGESMADRFARRVQFQLGEVVDIALSSLEGLAAVHSAGIVHRDIKPENIFLVSDPAGAYVKLLDFGISRAARKEAGLRSAVTTEDGLMIGTPEYMSPEQARGLIDVDQRTDLYGLGVVMYEALSGHVPYESENAGDLLVMVIAGQAPPLAQVAPAVGAEVSHVVATAMARDREQRYPSALHMLDALRAASRGLPRALALPEVKRLGRASTDPRTSLVQALEHVHDQQREQAREHAPTVRMQAGSSHTATWLGFAAVTLLAAVVGYYGLRIRSEAQQRFIVVQSTASTPPAAGAGAAQSRPATSATDAPAPTVPDSAGAAAPPNGAAAGPPATTARPKPRPEPGRPAQSALTMEPVDPSQAVARAFVQQKARVARCLNDHADVVPAETDLDVRIALDPSGKVREVVVLPASIGSSGAGPCIVAAVQAMSFGAQPGPLTVHVPISARRK
ncbi:MAG TPA: protein kinase [Polyangiales bacterium]|nr:protein kinase [Polyangiales bacterium]